MKSNAARFPAKSKSQEQELWGNKLNSSWKWLVYRRQTGERTGIEIGVNLA
jgi:hypothetical protein